MNIDKTSSNLNLLLTQSVILVKSVEKSYVSDEGCLVSVKLF